MNKYSITIIFSCVLAICQTTPLTTDEGSSLIQQQAQHNYNHHQEVITGQDHSSASKKASSNNGYNSDGSFGLTFDNHNKEHRDRGYGYEKAYAYSRETAFFDFYDDKGALNARDLVEKYGSSGDNKDEDLLKNIAN